MRTLFGLAALLIALAIGYAIHTSQLQYVSNDRPLKQHIDLAGVQSDVMALAQAERLYMAANGVYATLEQLRRSGVMNFIPSGSRAGYYYSIEVDGSAHFRITARPEDPSQEGMPVFSVDETMQLSRK